MIEAMKQKMIQFCPNKLENEASWFGHLDLKTKHDCQERLNVTDKFPKWRKSVSWKFTEVMKVSQVNLAAPLLVQGYVLSKIIQTSIK